MTLDELRYKARLTPDELQNIYGSSASKIGHTATDKAIAVMMEEFKAMVEAGKMASDALHSFGYGECDGAWAIDTALTAHAALQEEIDHE